MDVTQVIQPNVRRIKMAQDPNETTTGSTASSDASSTAGASSSATPNASPAPAAIQPTGPQPGKQASPTPTPEGKGKGKGKGKEGNKFDSDDAAARAKEEKRKAQMAQDPMGSILEMANDLIASAKILGEQLKELAVILKDVAKEEMNKSWEKYKKANAVPEKAPTATPAGNTPNANPTATAPASAGLSAGPAAAASPAPAAPNVAAAEDVAGAEDVAVVDTENAEEASLEALGNHDAVTGEPLNIPVENAAGPTEDPEPYAPAPSLGGGDDE